MRKDNTHCIDHAERWSPGTALSLICQEHLERNNEIHKRAMEMLQIGLELRQVVEYCRTAYATACQKYLTKDDRLNGVSITMRQGWEEQAQLRRMVEKLEARSAG